MVRPRIPDPVRNAALDVVIFAIAPLMRVMFAAQEKYKQRR